MPLLSLPNEIIAEIVEYGLLGDPKGEKAAVLSLVCKRFHILVTRHVYSACLLRLYQDPDYHREHTFGHAVRFERWKRVAVNGFRTARDEANAFIKYGDRVKYLNISHCLSVPFGSIRVGQFNYSIHASVYLPTIVTPLLSAFTNLVSFAFSTAILLPTPIKSHETMRILGDVFELCHSLRNLLLYIDVDARAPALLKRMIEEYKINPPEPKRSPMRLRSVCFGFSVSNESDEGRYSDPISVWVLTWLAILMPFSDSIEGLNFAHNEYINPIEMSAENLLSDISKVEPINVYGYKIDLPKVKRLTMSLEKIPERIFGEYFVVGKEYVEELTLLQSINYTPEQILELAVSYPNLELLHIGDMFIGDGNDLEVMEWSDVATIKKACGRLKRFIGYTELGLRELEECLVAPEARLEEVVKLLKYYPVGYIVPRLRGQYKVILEFY
ncbi:hypothetical protein TWF481_002244 [Arthrobotrys musiformis]|uniref:F-box domain-containing protein n=1 Tax=Arthrobotrys musiformis TaxID=47236 RepID=A0AAV9VSN7_9PEZI